MVMNTTLMLWARRKFKEEGSLALPFTSVSERKRTKGRGEEKKKKLFHYDDTKLPLLSGLGSQCLEEDEASTKVGCAVGFAWAEVVVVVRSLVLIHPVPRSLRILATTITTVTAATIENLKGGCFLVKVSQSSFQEMETRWSPGLLRPTNQPLGSGHGSGPVFFLKFLHLCKFKSSFSISSCFHPPLA